MQESIAPDPSYRSYGMCCWPRCWNSASRRYKIPVCDYHAQCIEQRVRWRDRKWQEAELRSASRLFGRGRDKVEAKSKPEQAAVTSETIYYVRVGSYIKVGWTSNLDQRMRDFPPDSLLLATHPGTRQDEQTLHKKFAVHRSHGREWYPLVPQLMDHIKRVVREHGEPEDATFGARPVEVPQPRAKQYTRPRYWRGKRSA